MSEARGKSAALRERYSDFHANWITLSFYERFEQIVVRVIAQQKSIIQVKTVLLIALLAISRKFIILDADTPPQHVLALAAVVGALGTAYWLIRDSNVRRRGTVDPVS